MKTQHKLLVAKPLAALALLGLGALGSVHDAGAKTSTRDRAAIVSAVKSYIKRTSPAIGAVTVTKLDVQGAWAIATAIPDSRDMENADVLLRKRNSHWKVLVLGSSLNGTGKQYGVPKSLWKKWGL